MSLGASTPMEEHRQLVLAACIAEWATVLSHLRAMGQTEQQDRIADELHYMCLQWPDVTLPLTLDEAVRIIRAARTFAGERVDELGELLSDE